MGRTAQVRVSSRLTAPAEAVWEAATQAEGINHELGPWLRMTVPREAAQLDVTSAPVGRRLGRSWVLLLGVLPFDYDDITLVRVDPGRGFLERSRMLSQRSWEHERTIAPAGDGCVVSDRVRFEPRLGVPGTVLRPLVRAIFRHRHRRLRELHGGTSL